MIVNNYDNSWIIHSLEYIIWNMTNTPITSNNFRNQLTNDDIRQNSRNVQETVGMSRSDIFRSINDANENFLSQQGGGGGSRKPLLNYPKKYMKNMPNYYNTLRH